MGHLFLSSAHKSSGKTTVTAGLTAALRSRGLTVQTFKKGPDYIDPLWLTAAAGRSCYNLDFHTMAPAVISSLVQARVGNADISLIEGSKGLYDGLDIEGKDSSAALAALLQAPVILVIDTRGMTRGIAALLTGYQHFSPAVVFAGVILNHVGGSRHEAKLRAAIERYNDLPVLGALGHDRALAIAEAELGLHPVKNVPQADRLLRRLGARVAEHVDLDRLLKIAGRSCGPAAAMPQTCGVPQGSTVRIGIARDDAFSFYYPDDLQALEAAGAELVTLDTLRDRALPIMDGLIIGGGFPERHLGALEANRSLRTALARAIDAGLPVYAECGGLMYLARQIQSGDQRAAMVGALPIEITMLPRPQGRGYAYLEEIAHPWPALEPTPPSPVPAHEFHYSRLAGADETCKFAYRVARGHGVDGNYDGIVHRNTLASYCHLRDIGPHHWARRFVSFVRKHRDGR